MEECKYIKREGAGCSLNNKCRFPECMDEEFLDKVAERGRD